MSRRCIQLFGGVPARVSWHSAGDRFAAATNQAVHHPRLPTAPARGDHGDPPHSSAVVNELGSAGPSHCRHADLIQGAPNTLLHPMAPGGASERVLILRAGRSDHVTYLMIFSHLSFVILLFPSLPRSGIFVVIVELCPHMESVEPWRAL